MLTRIYLLLIILLSLCGGMNALAQNNPDGNRDTLKILCYNLRFGELATLEELAEFIKDENPDLVALQEVDVKTYRDRAPHQNGKDFITELGYRTGMLTAYGKTIPHAGGYYGIGILSKYPLAQTNRILLPMPEGAKEQRAVLVADVELPDGKMVSMACTHLDYTTSAVRQAQVKAINDTLRNNPYPLILAGDFNARPDAIEIEKGMTGWKDVSTPDFTVPASSPRHKIDYIFVRPADAWETLSAKTPQVTLSDHLPLIAVVVLE